MDLHSRRSFQTFRAALLLLLLFPSLSFGQQVVQRGPFGKPISVYDETQQWSAPLLLASDNDIEIYIPDVTANDWLSRNYSDFEIRGIYTLSLFTRYKTAAACRANQTSWGMGDAEHLDACKDIGYRIRQVKIEPGQKSVQILLAAMVDRNGQVNTSSIQQTDTFKTWDQLDATAQKAILKANEIVVRQMRIYDARIQNTSSRQAPVE
jgi:hypothetical protein